MVRQEESNDHGQPASSVGGVTENVWLAVATFIFLWFYGRKLLKRLQEYLRFTRMKRDIHRRFGGGSGACESSGAGGDMPAVNGGATGVGDEDADEESAMAWGGESKSSKARTSPTTLLCLHLADGSVQETQLDLRAMKSMKEVQATVLQEWMQAGGDSRESLMMEYEDATGATVKVTKTTDIVALRSATMLNLLPKHRKTRAAASGSAYGRMNQDALDDLDARPAGVGALD